MTTFYLVRHGQSEGNLYGRFIGQGDVPLTELGVMQAQKTAEHLKDVKFDLAYTSDLIRARKTGEVVLGNRKMALVSAPNMREIFAGEWEGKTFDSLDIDYKESYALWKNEVGKASPDGGEPVSALYDRVNRFILEVAEQNEGATVLIATHATPIRCIVAKANGLPSERLHEIPWSPNSSVTVIGVENGKFSVISPSSADHLGDLATFLPKNV